VNTDELLPEVLAAAAEAFGRPVDADDNFFSLGGDSLAMVELITALEHRLARWAGDEAAAVIDDEAVISAASFADLASELAARIPAAPHGRDRA